MIKRDVDLSPDWVRERVGFGISDEDIEDSLNRLELTVSRTEDGEGKPLFRVRIPSFRGDLYRPIDLVEEVIRMYGSDRIPEASVRATVTLREDDPVPVYQRRATGLLTGKGFQETVHYSLRDEKETKLWYGESALEDLALENPLASDASHLRPSLIPGLLDCLKLNHARHNEAVRLFECGRVFRAYNENIYELFSVGFVIAQEGRESWKAGERPDFYAASRIVSDLLEQAGVLVNNWQMEPVSGDHPWQAGHAARCGGFASGYEAKFGLLNVGMTRDWDIETPVIAGAVYFLPEFLQKPASRTTYCPFSLQPPAIRDLAVVVAESVPAGSVDKALKEAAGEHAGGDVQLESLKVFDVYTGKGLPEGHKSIACRLVFRNPERTLNDKEVNTVFQNIQNHLDKVDGMQVRR
jgi:phenylalanyl-tRNA synthetase beta chain